MEVQVTVYARFIDSSQLSAFDQVLDASSVIYQAEQREEKAAELAIGWLLSMAPQIGRFIQDLKEIATFESKSSQDDQLQLSYVCGSAGGDFGKALAGTLSAFTSELVITVTSDGYEDEDGATLGMRHLLENGRIRAERFNPYEEPELTQAICNALCSEENRNDYEKALRLIDSGSDVEVRNQDGETPLNKIMAWGQFTPTAKIFVEKLLARGVNPNTADKSGYTPLLWLLHRQDVDPEQRIIQRYLLEQLIDHGADANITIRYQLEEDFSIYTTALNQLIEYGNIDDLALILPMVTRETIEKALTNYDDLDAYPEAKLHIEQRLAEL